MTKRKMMMMRFGGSVLNFCSLTELLLTYILLLYMITLEEVVAT